MPMYKKRSYGKKRTFKRRAGASWLTRYQPRAMAINRQAPGLGRSLKTKLKTVYSALVSVNETGNWSSYINPGSCYNPMGLLDTVVQPGGYDQLKALYARYLVTGATVRVTLTGCSNTTVSTWVATAYPSTVTSIPSTFNGCACQPYSQNVTFSNEEQKVMYFKLNTQKIVGSRLPVLAEDCGALVSTSPVNGQNIILPIFVMYQSPTASFARILIEIVQDVIFDQRIQVVDA